MTTSSEYFEVLRKWWNEVRAIGDPAVVRDWLKSTMDRELGTGLERQKKYSEFCEALSDAKRAALFEFHTKDMAGFHSANIPVVQMMYESQEIKRAYINLQYVVDIITMAENVAIVVLSREAD